MNTDKMKGVNFISLFAGIGGIDLGLERAGMSCVAQVEWNEYCQSVLQKHWPNVRKFRDVRDFGIDKWDGPPVDVIAGGFPCQPHSMAGRRGGSEDERDMWGEYARIIGEFRPRWIVAENVPAVLSSDDGRYFGNVLSDLAEIGYDATWNCISAAMLGYPHQRDRLFIVAYPNSKRWIPSAIWQRVEAEAHKAKIGRRNQLQPRLVRGATGRLRLLPHASLFRVGDGFPTELDKNRLRGLGNAVVPDVAEVIGKALMDLERWKNPRFRHTSP